ncbi:MAG TPA: transglutaminase domain-containing protein [Clostridia bacterium]|nr:transglutaminase domain-containing protein [Clostridia bacterium]
MKKNKVSIYILIIVLTASLLPLPVFAASPTPAGYEKAIDLKILGLLKDAPEDFQLDRAVTRLDGVIMYVHLLGKDKQVRQGHFTHPFTDVPGQAGNYAGFAYQNKLLQEIGKSKFVPDEPLTVGQFLTFVLSSLGYRDNIDFDSGNVLEKAVEKSLLSKSEASGLNCSKALLRNSMIDIAYNALSAKMKDSSKTLLDKLVTTDRTVYKPAAAILGLYTSDLQEELGGMGRGALSFSGGTAAKTNTDLYCIIRNTIYHHEAQVTIDVGSYRGDAEKDFEKTFERALEAVVTVSGVQSPVSSWKYLSSGGTLDLTLEYRYSKSEYDTRKSNYESAVDKARNIAARQLTDEMSEYAREKALHDYIISNTVFDYENFINGTIPDTSFDAFGCLVRGTAVCEGYTEAMKLLCDLAGIECLIVTGESKNSGVFEEHAWNIVKIDGTYCHVDLTSDDPVTNDGSNMLTYCYFNLTDSEMAKVSKWDRRGLPVCNSNRNGYYYRNNRLANNRNDFDKALLKALGQRSNTIEIRVMDYTKPKYSNLTDVMVKSGNVLKYRYTVNDVYGVIRIFNIKYS